MFVFLWLTGTYLILKTDLMHCWAIFLRLMQNNKTIENNNYDYDI